MNTLHHLEALELDKVLKMLSTRAAIEDAKELALSLRPETDFKKVEILLNETDDAFKLSAGFGSPSFGSAKNVANPLARAKNGGVLSMRELLDIAEVLRIIRSLKEWRAHCENTDSPYVAKYFEALIPNRYFEDKITTSIRSEDEMDDNASPKLKDIRRKIHSSELNVRDRLEKMIRSSSTSKFLQDAIITQRDGRFVVPVRADSRNEVPGLLHDTSGSGATLFIEPMAVVEINNEIRELKIKEKEEIDRILAELSSEAATFATNIATSYEATVKLCLIFAKASLAFSMRACKPQLNQEGKIYLKNARHPLLDPKTVVPVTIPLGIEYDTLMITGPNTGGKTVSIKTVGLLTLMAMCGLMLPVSDGSQVSVFKNVLADIGDEQSIEQSLSTFSSHMKRIIDIMAVANEQSLVLIDELGAGTDPVEGAALAQAILMKLREKNAKIAATTHYAELKSYALETDGVCNASCEFDVQSLKPTYKLNIGLPGRSNAFAISEKLGLDKQTVEMAKSLVSDEDARFERVVAALETATREAEKDRQEASRLKGEMEAMKSSRDAEAEELRKARDKTMEKAREQANALVERARAEAEKLLSELEALKKSNDSAEERIRRARAEMRGGLKRLEDVADPVETAEISGGGFSSPLKKGEKVIFLDLKKEVTVISDQKGDEVEILAGSIKTKVLVSHLAPKPKNKGTVAKTRTVKKAANPEGNVRSAQSEIDIRGFTGDEAGLELDRFIDNSV
ncbi:MAG: endonuclease MutS2, partial [Clostridia bacterium]|nr:endonuclease MutS2 [Clostridia bacterium]